MEILNLTGQQFGQSELREFIAIGESGAVYRGYHHGLEKTVAVKVLLPALTRHDAAFMRDMKQISQMEQANILPVYEYGVEQALTYITTRLVTGGTLKTRRAWVVANNRALPSLREIASFFRQTAAALDYANRRNILHRDIKPSNIIFDSSGAHYLTDFGIGQLKNARQNESKELTVADDQQALVATIATLLVNPLPFDMDNPANTMVEHMDEFAAVLRTRYPEASEVMLPIFQRAFASDPEERFPTALDCSQAFDAVRPFPSDVTNFFTLYTPQEPIPAAIQAIVAPQAVEVEPLAPVESVVVSSTPDGLVPIDRRPMRKNPLFWGLGLLGVFLVWGMLLTLPKLNNRDNGNNPRSNNNNDNAPRAEVTAIPDAAVVELVNSGVQHNGDWTPIEQEINNLPMVQVPAGCFTMGKENSAKDFEVPAHQVCVSSFWIGKTEVTNAQYRACVDDTACEPPSDRTYFDDPQYDEYPVVFVSWTQAAAFAEWVGGSLPTEAQWEFAARGPENWLYAWGDEHDGTRLNFCDASCARDPKNLEFDDGYAMFAPVGSFPEGASWVGALDITGNVWEWAADWYGFYSEEAQVDPTGPAEGDKRVLRGGSWTNTLDGVRATYRTNAGETLSQPHAGFRIAMPAEAGS